MALAKSRLDSALYKRPLKVSQAALVVGGGPAGMTAALELADQGFLVHLVEREKELGGHARGHRTLLTGEDPRQGLWELMSRVRMHPRIDLQIGANLEEVQGSLGNFRSTIAQGETRIEVEHGVVIVATGAERYVPTELLYGKDPRVIRQFELEEMIADRKLKSDSVVFVQCVGSRSEERPYCSRTCCLETVKNAIRIKEQNPDADVHVLYRDIRTYGVREKFYREARDKGVRFIRYADGTLPEVAPHNGRLSISVDDQMSKRTVELEADTLVLAAATIPNPGNKELAQLLKVPLSEEGFFLEAHRKLRPVDFATEGIFLCGAAHSPLGLRETTTQAAAVAARAATILARGVIDLEPTISHVVEKNCDGCAYCVDPCPYHAIAVIEYDENGTTKKRVKVDEALCKGCGTCEATCPKNGIFVWHFRPEQLMAQIHAALSLEA